MIWYLWGKSFNETATGKPYQPQLADTEATISELKTAKVVLQKDIEEEKWSGRCVRNFSNVSHELKLPLQLIQDMREGLKEEINDDDEESGIFDGDKAM